VGAEPLVAPTAIAFGAIQVVVTAAASTVGMTAVSSLTGFAIKIL
jgi:hypothetical protein